MTKNLKLTSKLAVASAVAAFLATSMQAATTWTGGGSDTLFGTAGNWNNGLPDSSGTNDGTINNGTVTTALAAEMSSANVTWTGTSTLTTTAAARVYNGTHTAQGSVAWTISTGGGTADFLIGRGAAGSITSILNWDSTGTLTVEDNFLLGRDTTGTMTQSAGTVSVGNEFFVGRGTGVAGNYTLSGGSFETVNLTFNTLGTFDFTNGSTGTFSLMGGGDQTATIAGAITAGDFTIGGLTDAANTSWDFSNVFDGTNTVLSVTAVPEPSTYALIAGALALVSVMIRRRK